MAAAPGPAGGPVTFCGALALDREGGRLRPLYALGDDVLIR
jgi:hypothetical protein